MLLIFKVSCETNSISSTSCPQQQPVVCTFYTFIYLFSFIFLYIFFYMYPRKILDENCKNKRIHQADPLTASQLVSHIIICFSLFYQQPFCLLLPFLFYDNTQRLRLFSLFDGAFSSVDGAFSSVRLMICLSKL